MFKISSHICSELKDSDIILKKLELNERKRILNCILKRYIDFNLKSSWLWERLLQYASVNDDMAWRRIKDFVNNNECVLFFEQAEEQEMFLIQSGKDLDFLLSETYGFEFYVTDIECSYLLCLNHHNILYGCGTAEEWIKDIKSIL